MPSLTLLLARALPEHSHATGEPARWPGWLSRARVLRSHVEREAAPSAMPDEHWLADVYGLPCTGAARAASAAMDGIGMPAMRLTPAHLHAARDHLVLTDPALLDLDMDEAGRFADVARPLFAAEGLMLHTPCPMRWYLTGTLPALTGGAGSSVALGRSIDAYLPAGPDARRWRRLLNEIQMTWFAHALNETRRRAGKVAVNTLWVEGSTAPPTRRPFDRVVAVDPMIRGLALGAPSPAIMLTPSPETCGARPSTAQTAAPTSSAASASASPTFASAIMPDSDKVPVLLAGLRRGEDILIAPGLPGIGPNAPADVARLFDHWCRALTLRGLPPVGAHALNLILTGERAWIALCVDSGHRWKIWRAPGAAPWLDGRAP